MARSTVGAILRWLGLGKLKALEPKPPVVRYERAAPGGMIHLDNEKLGRFDVAGHRATGDRPAGRSYRADWDFLHVCFDDASRLAYTQILTRERKEDTTGFPVSALAWLGRHGVTVERVMTDNGSAYRSRLFRQALPILHRANPGHRLLDLRLQPHPTTCRHRRPHPSDQDEQPPWQRQLAREPLRRARAGLLPEAENAIFEAP